MIVTFCGVGIATALFYFCSGLAAVEGLPASTTTGSLAAYAVSAVLSYYGHMHLSFTSARAHAIEAPRFVTTTAIRFLLAYLPMATERMGLPRCAAYAAVCVVVPPLTSSCCEAGCPVSGASDRRNSGRLCRHAMAAAR